MRHVVSAIGGVIAIPAVHRLVLLLVAGCAAPGKPPIDHRGSIAPMALEITLSRTECFGTCPVYTVTIHGDTRVDWRGESHVEATGERHASITRSELEALAATIDRIGFFHLDEFGTPRDADPMRSIVICSDVSSAIVTIERHGQRHTTHNDHCNPSPATELEDQIEAVTHTARWIGARRKYPLAAHASRSPSADSHTDGGPGDCPGDGAR